MTNDTATNDRAGAERDGAPPDAGAGSPDLPVAVVLAGLAVAWLAAMLWVAHRSISSDVGAVALATAASSLPPVVSAGLVAGAAAGLLAAAWLARTRAHRATRPAARWAVALGAGAVTGVAAGAAFVLGSGTDPARMAVGGTLAAAATVGGALAGVRTLRVVAGVVAGALGVFATGFLLSLVKSPIQQLYGAGGDEASQLSAAGWYAATAATASGLAAGLLAYRVLGGTRRNPALRWPAYLVAGAGAGGLLLVAELIIRTGGAKMLALVRNISDADRALQAWAEGSRINNGLVVLFVGAIVALILHGRTLGGGEDTDRGEDSDSGEDADRGAGTYRSTDGDSGWDSGDEPAAGQPAASATTSSSDTSYHSSS